MTELIRRISPAQMVRLSDVEQATEGAALRLDSVRLRAPIPYPAQDVICLGINYADHAVESARFHEDAFLVNRKKSGVLQQARVRSVRLRVTRSRRMKGLVDSLDYEAELGVVIGKDCKNVSVSEAPGHIFGYTIVNDVSARNLQTAHNQWYFGKSLDGFTRWGRVSSRRMRLPIRRRWIFRPRSMTNRVRTATPTICCILWRRSLLSCRKA